MRIRPSVYLFCVTVILVTALIIWFARQPAKISQETVESQPAVNHTAATLPQTNANVPALPSNVSAAPHFVQQTKNPSYDKERDEQRREIMATENTVPIIFYGKLEDQSGNPVVGAEITGNTIINNGTMYGHTNVVAVSDINGFFTLDAGKGESIGIVPRKAGYALATTDTEFKYSLRYPDHFVPDPNRPVVIKMWKLQGTEPLVNIQQDYRLRYIDAPINFDLLTGQTVSSGGDLRIMVHRPAGVISGSNPQDWSIDFEVVGGGFIETSPSEAGVTFFAPQSGYQARGTFGKNNGPDLIDKVLFIQSRNGQVYSKVHLLFGINVKPDGFMDVTFSGVANTNGSGNWEAAAPQ